MEIGRPGSQPSGEGPTARLTGRPARIDPLFNPPEPARAAQLSSANSRGA